MNTVEIVAQIMGIVGMAINCLSFQNKKAHMVIVFQLFGSMFFAINYFMISAFSGAILNVLGIVRAIVFLFEKKLNTKHPLWTIGFVVLYLCSYVLVFTVFAKSVTPTNLIVELLPVIGMVLTTLSFRASDAKIIRIYAMLNAPFWLTYNIINVAIGGICCESINLVSIVIGMIRHDMKKKEKEKTDDNANA